MESKYVLNRDFRWFTDRRPRAETNKRIEMQSEQHEVHRSEQTPIRELFPDEASDFTPWLAKRGNLQQLGKALYFDLELKGREVDCGGFALDILAKDRARGSLVAIENQLEGSDTRHFGQLLTYAAVQGVQTLVWIAPSFWQKHLDALSWLNANTSDKIEIYGVEVHGKRIRESEYSVDLRPVVVPEIWRNRSGQLGFAVEATGKKYRRFFQPIVTALWWDGLTDNGHAYYRSEQPVPSGFQDISYYVGFGGDNKLWIYLWIGTSDGEYNRRVLQVLKHSADSIEKQVDSKLCWVGQPKGRIQASFGILREGSIDDPQDELCEIRNWMAKSLRRFMAAVHPHLKSAVALVQNSDQLR